MNTDATELPDPVQGSNIDAHIRASKFDLLVRQSSPTPAISVATSGFIAFLLWDVQDHFRLLVWFALVSSTGIMRIAFFHRYRKNRPPSEDIGRWELVYRITIVLYFLSWGLGGAWVMPAQSPLHQMVVMYFLVGLAGSAISVFSADRVSLIVSVCCIMLPGLLWLGLRGDTLSVICSLAGVAFLLSAARSSRVFSDTYTENLELTERLALARQRAEHMTEQASEALAEAEDANAAKSRFFAAAHHDLRQPIHAARMMTTVLARSDLDQSTADMVRGISTSVETLSDQLDGFLEVSRLAAGVMPVHLSSFRIDSLLESLVFEYTAVAAEKAIDLTLDCAEDILICTDYVLLERILRNLLGNAVAHNRDCKLALSVQAVEGGYLMVVADSGRGIPQDRQQLVFEEFYQLQANPGDDHDGLGLGLAIVQRLQLLLGLNMQMESGEGVGTRFTFCLPGIQESRAAAPAPG